MAMSSRTPVLLGVIAAFTVAASAHAAGPYYVEPGPSAHHGLPCDVLNPCAIDWALDMTHLPAGSTVLIEAGTYDVTASPPVVMQPLTIEPDPAAASVPLIESGASFQPVLKFDTGSDGSRLTGVDLTATGLAKPALNVTVPATIDHVVVASTTVGIDAAATANISDATVTATGSSSAVGIIDEPGSAGGGQITDTNVRSDGLGVQAGGQVGPGAVMRRLNVAAKGVGVEEISGPLTLTDSLVTSASGDGLQAQNGTLTARNDTVMAPAGDALHTLASPLLGIDPGTIDVRNTIARGAIDAVADPGSTAPQSAVIDIGYSNVVTTSRVTDLGHNQPGNPLFVNSMSDFHLQPTSPAIDAGITDPADGPTDLDGRPRVQGAAPDIGAYEATPVAPVAPAPGSPGPPVVASAPADTTAPVVSGLSMTHRRFADRAGATHARGRRGRVVRGTAFAFTVSEAARVTIAIVAETSGRRSHGRCVRATRRLAHARRCTRLVAAGTVVHAVGKGHASVAFSGRIGKRTLAAGRYRATLTAVDAAGNRSAPHSVTFAVV